MAKVKGVIKMATKTRNHFPKKCMNCCKQQDSRKVGFKNWVQRKWKSTYQ